MPEAKNGRGWVDWTLRRLLIGVVAVTFGLGAAAYSKASDNEGRLESIETHLLWVREALERVERKVDRLLETGNDGPV